MTILVAYSNDKKMKIISNTIAERLSAECIEVKDLKRKSGFFNNLKNNINAIRLTQTEINPQKIDFEKYEFIFLGSPSTLGNPSPAILTLIENSEFKNKNIIIYTTTHSNQGTSVLKEMKKRIEAKGGRIVNTFILHVQGKTNEELIENSIHVLYKLDLDLYI